MMKRTSILGFLAASVILVMSGAAPARAQDDLLEALFTVASPTGYEDVLAGRIETLLPANVAADRDNLGSLWIDPGGGSDRLALICALDEYGYIVSGVTEDGYINLDRVVPEPHSGFDGFFFGHGLAVRTQKHGIVTGIQALPSLHIFPRSRRADLERLFSLENALLDVGASSPEEVRAKGIAVLDPVTPMTEIVPLAGSLMSGYSLGLKACASVFLELARTCDLGSGAPTLIWTAQTKFLRGRGRTRQAVGALAVLSQLDSSRVIVVDTYACRQAGGDQIAPGLGPALAMHSNKTEETGAALIALAAAERLPLQRVVDPPSALAAPFLEADRLEAVILLPVKYHASPSEVIDRRDIESLTRLLRALIEGRS